MRVRIDNEEDRKRQMQRVINAYHRVFDTPEGKLVLEDFVNVFGLQHPAYISVGTQPGEIKYDETYGKLRDGQRSVYLHIEARLRGPVTGDANIEGEEKVRTGLSDEHYDSIIASRD